MLVLDPDLSITDRIRKTLYDKNRKQQRKTYAPILFTSKDSESYYVENQKACQEADIPLSCHISPLEPISRDVEQPGHNLEFDWLVTSP